MDQSDDDVWKTTDMGWGVHPEGIRKMLNYIQVRPGFCFLFCERGFAFCSVGVLAGRKGALFGGRGERSQPAGNVGLWVLPVFLPRCCGVSAGARRLQPAVAAGSNREDSTLRMQQKQQQCASGEAGWVACMCWLHARTPAISLDLPHLRKHSMPCSARTYIRTHRQGQAHTPLIGARMCMALSWSTLAARELHGDRHCSLAPAWAHTPHTGALHGRRSSSGSGMLVTEAAASMTALHQLMTACLSSLC